MNYSSLVVTQFNHQNGLDIIARGKGIEISGYKTYFSPNENLISLLSIPNYCYRASGNEAAFVRVNGSLKRQVMWFAPAEESG